MVARFVCLANSFKEGGRCVAGIELDGNNNPKMEKGHPKWIRPVCNSLHGEIDTNLVAHLKILDITEISITGFPEEKNYQSENIWFSEDSLKILGRYNVENLKQICNSRNLIFGNRGKSVSEEIIDRLSYSLMLIKTSQFEVVEKIYQDNKSKSQCRLVFTYNENLYDFPITDPAFLHRYKNNHDLLKSSKELLFCASLGIAWNGWYYKLVAGIIYQ
jgi:hypothetical protein